MEDYREVNEDGTPVEPTQAFTIEVQKKGLTTGQKVAIGIGIAAAVGGTAYLGYKHGSGIFGMFGVRTMDDIDTDDEDEDDEDDED
jgi:hypothetical protein